MKKQPCSRYFRVAHLFPAALLLACSFSIPFLQSSGSGGGQLALHNAPDLLADPLVGLADLKSYHASFHQDITGTLDGKPLERHTRIELTRASGQSDFLQEFQGTDEPSFYFRAIGMGQAAYRLYSPDETCQGSVGEVYPEEKLEPAELLIPIVKTSKVGTETINQIPAIHYHFDQNGLPLTDPKPSVTGEIWLAEQGGYLVKYLLNAAMPANPTGKGLEAAQTWSYELSQVNSIESVTLPRGCMPVPVDIPVMADAKNVSRISGRMEYETASSAAQVVDFYYQNLPSLGWTTKQQEPTGELKLPVGLAFIKGDLSLSVNIDPMDAGGLDVTIVIYNPKEPAVAGTPAATMTPAKTATPGVLPTVKKSESGLPEDVPLYPGAAGLTKLTDQAIEFETTDTPDQVDRYYQQQMPAQKWTLMSNTKQGTTIIQLWRKDNRVVSVTILPQGQKTVVMITFSNS
jgi:hypothetical protein